MSTNPIHCVLNYISPYSSVASWDLSFFFFPFFQGAKKLYTKHLRPFLLKHQAKVDTILGSVSDEMVTPPVTFCLHRNISILEIIEQLKSGRCRFPIAGENH